MKLKRQVKPRPVNRHVLGATNDVTVNLHQPYRKKKEKNPITTFIFIKQDKGLWDHRPTTATSNGIKKFRENHLKGTHYEPCDLISHKTKLQSFLTAGPISIKQRNLMQCYFFVSFLNVLVFFVFFCSSQAFKMFGTFFSFLPRLSD